MIEYDTADWSRAVEANFARLGHDSETALYRLADDIADEERATAPRSAGKRISRRHGASSIGTKRGRDTKGVFVDVGPTRKGFWLAFQEFGTSKQAPRPFMRPAIERCIARWKP